MVLILRHELSVSDKKAYKEAKELVYVFERQHNGDTIKISAALMKEQDKLALDRPSEGDIHKLRTLEIAFRYAHVSDGNMGIDLGSHKTKIRDMTDILEGRVNGAFSYSQQLAIDTGRHELLSTPNAKWVKERPPSLS